MSDSQLDEARRRSFEVWDAMAKGWGEKVDYIWNETRHVGEWLVAHVDPQSGETILDVAAGPGDTGFVAAKLVGDQGRLISTDFSPHMVEAARSRATSLGIENVHFEVMDAEHMNLGAQSVDAILCRWGLMLMHDPQTALVECSRVLRPGGRLAFAVWAGAEKNPWVTLTGMTLLNLGHEPPGDPFGPGGMFSLSDPDQLTKMLGAAGFANPTLEELDVRWTFARFEEFWEFLTQLAGAIAALIQTLSEEQVQELREGLRDALSSFKAGDGYAMPGVTICAFAKKGLRS